MCKIRDIFLVCDSKIVQPRNRKKNPDAYQLHGYTMRWLFIKGYGAPIDLRNFNAHSGPIQRSKA